MSRVDGAEAVRLMVSSAPSKSNLEMVRTLRFLGIGGRYPSQAPVAPVSLRDYCLDLSEFTTAFAFLKLVQEHHTGGGY